MLGSRWLPAGSCLPQLLEDSFAQAPAVTRCPKNQRLYLFVLRGHIFIILFIRLVCKPSGCTLLLFIGFFCNRKGRNIIFLLLLLMKIEITL